MDAVISIGENAPKFHTRDLCGLVFSVEAMYGTIVVMNIWSAMSDK